MPVRSTSRRSCSADRRALLPAATIGPAIEGGIPGCGGGCGRAEGVDAVEGDEGRVPAVGGADAVAVARGASGGDPDRQVGSGGHTEA